jgi:hypothetical protein
MRFLEGLFGNKALPATIAIQAVDELLKGLLAKIFRQYIVGSQAFEIFQSRVFSGTGNPCFADEQELRTD